MRTLSFQRLPHNVLKSPWYVPFGVEYLTFVGYKFLLQNLYKTLTNTTFNYLSIRKYSDRNY
jgi:hypothetical protein